MEQNINRWRILFLSTLVYFCTGSIYTFTVFATPLADQFGWSVADIMMAFSINIGILPIPMIIAGKLVDKGKGRLCIFIGGLLFASGFFLTSFVTTLPMLYLTYGVLMGFGSGIAYSGNLSNGLKFFPDKKGLASGVLLFGTGIGTTIASLLANYFIESFGVLIAFRLFGIIYLTGMLVLSYLIKSAPKEGYIPKGWTPPKPSTTKQGVGVEMHWREMIKTPKFYLMTLLFGLGTLAGLMIISNASQIGQSMFGLTAAIAAVYVSMVSLANSGGRVIWGSISDKLGRYNTLNVLFVVIIAMLALLYYADSALMFAVSAIGIGLSFGGVFAIIPSLVADNYGLKNQGINYALVYIGYSVASFFAPRIAQSAAATNNNDFSQAFLLAMVCSAVGIVITVILQRMGRAPKQIQVTKAAS